MFDQPDGQRTSYSDGRRVYRIGEDGVLKTKFPKTIHGALDQKYYYVDTHGNILSELKMIEGVSQKDNENYVMNGMFGSLISKSLGGTDKTIEFRVFAIGKPLEQDSLRELSDRVLKKVIYPAGSDTN